ncbi:hypothetical protein [Microbulbifer sp. TYP-18]|uniref:hypothetical protein n=1 Tax=Microbulbifer sp. TYP-18 TaxID=3230024 RepID=UPI0034C5C717
MQNEEIEKKREKLLTYCIAIGAGMGASLGSAFGAAFGSVAMGVSFGPIIGSCLGIVYWALMKDKKN